MQYPEKLTVYFEKIAGPRKIAMTLGLLMGILFASPVSVPAATHAVSATIDISKTGAPISKNMNIFSYPLQ